VKPGFLERGGLWVLGQGLLMTAVAVAAWACPDQWGRGWSSTVAAILFVGSAVFGIGGVVALGRHLTPFPRPGEGGKLVIHGIYGVVRHPLYTSVLLAALGVSMAQASGPALGLTAVLGLFFNAKAIREERWLRERYPEYEDYARRVRRLIPGVY